MNNDDFPKIFSDLLLINARDYPDQLAMVYGDLRLSWRDFDRLISIAANAFLRSFPNKRGSRITILMENRPEWLIPFYGAQRAGMVPAPISTRLISSDIGHIFKISSPIACVSSVHYFKRIINAFKLVENCPSLIVVDKSEENHEKFQSWSEFIDKVPDTHPSAIGTGSDLGVQLFTAGTTGMPKGVNFTHHSLLDACNLIPEHGLDLIFKGEIPEVALLPTTHEMKFLVPTPLYHLSGFVPALIMTAMKRPVVFPTSVSFTPEEICNLIEKEEITTVFMVPTQFQFFLDHLKLNSYDLSSVTLFSSGGSKMSAEMKKEILTRFPEALLVDGYGQTENIGAAIYSFLKFEDIPKITEGYIGKPISGVEMRVVDERGNDVASGEVGEAIYRSPSLMRDYHGDDNLTSEAHLKLDNQKWFRTGDLFKVDEEGNYYYVDRVDDLIITGGEKVFAGEVEEVIRKHPKVYDVVVIGESNKKWGKIVKAYVAPKRESQLFPEEIIEWCVGKISSFKKPKIVEIREHLPIGEDGKISRAHLFRNHDS
ncbi:MAG: class I adenylate-forming enzyme family protein [Candidatus Hodarchaeales archaeon]|jgi:acyl-CoA synthetase (AMP-forming)/AMP-acid ligase II